MVVILVVPKKENCLFKLDTSRMEEKNGNKLKAEVELVILVVKDNCLFF